MKAETIAYDAMVREFRKEGNSAIAEHSSRFFKTGKGEYGQGDRFLGIRVPVTRKYAGKYRDAPLAVVEKLLKSVYHEERLLAVIMLADRFKRGGDNDRQAVYELYLGHTPYINNWDIVDSSAPLIVGPHLERRDRKKLYTLARSASLWERRIAVMATLHYIRGNAFDTALEICELLVNDTEDLIHKAVGWMLREIGKRDPVVEERFLQKHAGSMPRTMLRYAIEKFPAKKRQAYLRSKDRAGKRR